MKKTLGIILAVLLTLMLSVPALAEDKTFTENNGTSTQDIKASYEPGEKVADEVYHITVQWEVTSNLAYKDGNITYTWNVDKLQYDDPQQANGTWTGTATVKVTVTNKSNAEVSAKAEWNAAANIGAECDFTNSKTTATAASAAGTLKPGDTGTGSATSDTIEATVEVKSGKIQENDATIGTMTVTINPQG